MVPSADPPEPIDAFIDEYRARALWFLRDDYYPQDEAELLRVLDHVEHHGDLTAFRRVAAIRQWLSQHSNATSRDVDLFHDTADAVDDSFDSDRARRFAGSCHAALGGTTSSTSNEEVQG